MGVGAVRAHKFRLLGLSLLLTVAIAAVIPSVRSLSLRTIGRTIAIPIPAVTSSDIIVLSLDVDGAGALAASDLVEQGISSRVAVFADPPDAVDGEFLRRGIPYYDAAAVSIRELNQLGVHKIEVISRSVSGSEEEAQLLPSWCDGNHFSSVVLVVNMDHGHRLQRILRRVMTGHHTKIIVYPTQYSAFNPDAWWQTRNGARKGIVELEKLALDIARHPVS
jgi:hypothetical protein